MTKKKEEEERTKGLIFGKGLAKKKSQTFIVSNILFKLVEFTHSIYIERMCEHIYTYIGGIDKILLLTFFFFFN
jgi:hypothetical protein